MGNIAKAKVTVRGVRPLLQHRFTEAALPLTKEEKQGVAGNNPEEWRKTCMVTKEGQLFIEPTYIFATLRNAAKHTKKGKGSIQTDVSATLQVLDDIILIENRFFPNFPSNEIFDVSKIQPPTREKTEPVYLDVCGVRNPSSKARNIRYRLACSKGWELSFNILWDKTLVATSQMQAVCNDAGILVGLGDGRGVGFGRFEIISFEVIEN